MHTYLIEGAAPLPFDNQILAIVREQSYDAPPGRPRYMGVLNADGELYRVIVTTSDIDAAGLADTLRVLNLTNRIRYSDVAGSVSDALTFRPIRTDWHSVLQIGDRPWPLPTFYLPRVS